MKIHNDQFNPVDVLPDYTEEENSLYDNEKQLHKDLNQLSDEKRELLVMSKFQGLKYEQIAQIRETSISAIKVQVHRTIKELRTLYFELDEK
jgi:RNA polymerase sigma-70 factor (ECF subfamily)